MRIAGLFLLALAAAASTLSAEEDYVVRLTRPKKVGERYRLDARGGNKERQKITIGGKVAKEEEKDVSVHLVATATVLAVDSKSEPVRIEYRIESCQRTSAGKTQEVLVAGRKVTVESKNGEAVFTGAGDRPLDAETLEPLKLVLSAHQPDSPTDDEIFGTKERKRVGDKWSIDTAAAARDLSKSRLSVSPADIKGSVQLVRARTVDSVNALEIAAHIRVEGIKMETPEGTTLEKAIMMADFNGLVPADPQSPSSLPETVRMEMSFLIGGQKRDTGEKVSIAIWTEITLDKSETPIKEAPKSKASLSESANLTPAGV